MQASQFSPLKSWLPRIFSTVPPGKSLQCLWEGCAKLPDSVSHCLPYVLSHEVTASNLTFIDNKGIIVSLNLPFFCFIFFHLVHACMTKGCYFLEALKPGSNGLGIGELRQVAWATPSACTQSACCCSLHCCISFSLNRLNLRARPLQMDPQP